MGEHIPDVLTPQVREHLAVEVFAVLGMDHTVGRDLETLTIIGRIGVHPDLIAVDGTILQLRCHMDALHLRVIESIKRPVFGNLLALIANHAGKDGRFGGNLIHHLALVVAGCLAVAIGPRHTVIAVLGSIAEHTLHGQLLPVLLKRGSGNTLASLMLIQLCGIADSGLRTVSFAGGDAPRLHLVAAILILAVLTEDNIVTVIVNLPLVF